MIVENITNITALQINVYILTSEGEHEARHSVQQLRIGEELSLGRQVVRIQDGSLENHKRRKVEKGKNSNL